jgi:hypothetical protein
MTRRAGRGTDVARRVRPTTEAPDVAVSKVVAVRLPDETITRLRKYGDATTMSFSVGDFLLAVVAFLGVIGHLPFMATGFAVAIREIARKALEKIV